MFTALKNIYQKLKRYWDTPQLPKPWHKPDHYFVAVLLGKDDYVYGEVKGKLALLEGTPKPGTGYHYMDIVEVEGPVGKQAFKDEEISQFRALKVHTRSNYHTFNFSAILTNDMDYFRLSDAFREENCSLSFPFPHPFIANQWVKGYCATPSLEKAIFILNGFAWKGMGRQVKDIEEAKN